MYSVFALSLLLFSAVVNAQSLDQQVIGSSGRQYVTASASVAFTIGGPLIDWLSSDAVPSGSVFEFHFEYLNTASTKQVMDLLKAIDARTPQLGLRIVWAYDEGDRGMLKTGQLLGKLLQHPMEFSERG